MKPRRLRNRTGQFLRRLPVTPESERCWLIWSRKWRAWHRRDGAGRAAGYTTDIAEAGLFPFSKAHAYHDGVVNEAFHVSEKVDLIDMHPGDVRRMLFQLEGKAAAARQVAA